MIVRVNIATGEQQIIEPINDADLRDFREIMKKLYYKHIEDKQKAPKKT